MLFNSLEFILFFAIVLCLYFVIPQKLRWILLLISSYVFYMFWNPKYVILIIISTLVDYIVSLGMGKTENAAIRKLLLLISLITNLGLLFVFKYFGMLINIINDISGSSFDALSLILPMGISFYTFQTLSYTIDVYRNKREPEKHIGYFALYVVYFPQLVAGPIERSNRLLPQLKANHTIDYERFVNGARRMLWGYFKKVVIADNLAVGVNSVFSDPYHQSGLILLISTLFFAFQIYCDFSGYSDIAIGASKIMGIDLMENFKRPYFAKSLKEFWSRWHISLTTWFKDYLYFPLGGSRKGKVRTYINISAVFLVSGLWHGADIKFLIWGGLHAVFQLLERSKNDISEKIAKLKVKSDNKNIISLKWLFTFLIVLIAWTFFRANNASEAMYILKKIVADIVQLNLFDNIQLYIQGLNMDYSQIIISIFSIVMLIAYDCIEEVKGRNIFELLGNRKILRWSLYYFIILYIMLFGVFEKSAFIYFQF